MTIVDAVGAAEHVEQPFTAVGQRRLVDVVAELPAGVADRRRGVGRCRRATELVECGEHAHVVSPSGTFKILIGR